MPGLHDHPVLVDVYNDLRLAEEAQREQYAAMHALLHEETLGVQLDEEGSMIAIEMVTIAAEGLAQTMARNKGLDPENPAFLSETIWASLNRDGAAEPYIIDPDRDPEWADKEVVDETMIGYFADKALQIAKATVQQAELQGVQ